MSLTCFQAADTLTSGLSSRKNIVRTICFEVGIPNLVPRHILALLIVSGSL